VPVALLAADRLTSRRIEEQRRRMQFAADVEHPTERSRDRVERAVADPPERQLSSMNRRIRVRATYGSLTPLWSSCLRHLERIVTTAR
jgi:hypothetical protein